MATAVHGGYVSPVAGRQGEPLDRTELDDLIDELLRDVDDYRRQSPRRPRSRGSVDDRSRSASACSRNESRSIHVDPVTTGMGSMLHQGSAAALHLDIDTDQDIESMQTSEGSSPVSSYSDTYSTTASSGFSVVARRGRLPSVPESIVINPPIRHPDQRLYSSDSEDQMSWLAQQKAKLQTKRQEIQSLPRIQSLQHRQLMAELKSARSFILRKQIATDTATHDSDEDESRTRTKSATKKSAPGVDSKPIRRPDVVCETKGLSGSSELYSPRSPSSFSSTANEKHYFVEGIERPPFTSNQTKYVFSISPPAAASPGTSRTHPAVPKSEFTFTPPSNVRRKDQQTRQEQQQQQQAPAYYWRDGMLSEDCTSGLPHVQSNYKYVDNFEPEDRVSSGLGSTGSPVVSPRPVRLKPSSAIGELTEILNSIPSPEPTYQRNHSRTTQHTYSSSVPNDTSGLSSRDYADFRLPSIKKTMTSSRSYRDDDFGRGKIVRPKPIVADAAYVSDAARQGYDHRKGSEVSGNIHDTDPRIDFINYADVSEETTTRNGNGNWRQTAETSTERVSTTMTSSNSMFAAVSDVVAKTRDIVGTVTTTVNAARSSERGRKRSTASPPPVPPPPTYDRDESHRYGDRYSTSVGGQTGYRYPSGARKKTGIDVGCQIDDGGVNIDRVSSARNRTNVSSTSQRSHETQTKERRPVSRGDSSDSPGTDDFSATEGELLILQPIGQGLMDLEPGQPEEAILHHGRSNPTMHAGTAGAVDDPANVKMSRSRSVDYAENRYLDDTYVGHKVDKRRSITPITYTRLDDWQNGRPEVYVLDGVVTANQLDAIAADSKTSPTNYQQKQSDKSQQKANKSQHRTRKHRKHANSSTNALPQTASTSFGLSVSDGTQRTGNGKLVSDSQSTHADSSSSSSSSSCSGGGSGSRKKSSDKADHSNATGKMRVGSGGGGRATLQPGGDNSNVHHSRRTPTSPSSSSHQLLSARTPSPLRGESPSLRYTTPRFVRDSSKYWHKPRISRDEAINFLKNKVAGTFVIRNSNSFPGAFGLALKVAHLPPNVHAKGHDPKADLVRHFLIEPTAKGVRLKGCSTEPVFGSLAALVYQHSLTPLSLPCKLIIPELPPENSDAEMDADYSSNMSTAQQILNQGAACNVLYVATMDTESLTGPEAIQKTVDFASSLNPAPNTTIVHFKVSSQGITLTDLGHKLFFRRHYPVECVSFCSLDPNERRWNWINGENQLPCTARLFGFVARKHGNSRTTENACHIFGEIDADQPAEAIVNFVMRVMLGQTRKLS